MVLDDSAPADRVPRVIDAFIEKLVMSKLGFECAQAAETGRPGCDPRDLLKLYLYGFYGRFFAGALRAASDKLGLAFAFG
jgi:transposase